MKVLTFLICFLCVNVINGSILLNTNNSDSFLQIGTSKLPKFICNVIESAKHEDQGLNTVAIVITENQLELSIIDDMMRCMPMEISTTMIDLRLNDGRMDVKAQMVIMFADQIDETNQMMTAILTANHMSKFLIVTSDPEKFNVQNFQQLFTSNGIQNFAIISQDAGSIVVQRPETFNGEVKVVREIQKSKRFYRQMFPDKLKNLHGYKFRVGIEINSQESESQATITAIKAFDVITEAQNASLEVVNISNLDQFQQSELDFTIHPKVTSVLNSNTLLLYNRDHFCVLISKLKQFSYSDDFLTRNVTSSVKILITLIYVSVFIIWKLCANRGAVDRPGDVVFKILAAYHDQSVNFSRHNRLTLTIMLQVIMIMTIFSNLMYQWVIGISLSFPHNVLSYDDSRKLFNNMQDTNLLIDSDFEIIALETMVNTNFADRILSYEEANFDYDNYDSVKVSVAGYCSLIKILNSGFEYIIQIPSQYHWSYIRIQTMPQNALVANIQLHINHVFEAGLLQYWTTMAKMKIYGKRFSKFDANVPDDLFGIFDMEKLMPMFSVLIQRLIVASFVFLLEIFYHEFIQKLSWDLIRRWTSSMVSTTSQETNANINWQNVGKIRRVWYFLKQRRNLRVRRVNVATVDAI